MSVQLVRGSALISLSALTQDPVMHLQIMEVSTRFTYDWGVKAFVAAPATGVQAVTQDNAGTPRDYSYDWVLQGVIYPGTNDLQARWLDASGNVVTLESVQIVEGQPNGLSETLGSLMSVSDSLRGKLGLVGASVDRAIQPIVYAGQKGDVVEMQIFEDGRPITDARMALATDHTVFFEKHGLPVIPVVATPGPGGKVLYTTAQGDGVRGSHGIWVEQGRVTMPDGSFRYSHKRQQSVQNSIG